MRELLINPVHGFFIVKDAIGGSGHFVTSPEIRYELFVCLFLSSLDVVRVDVHFSLISLVLESFMNILTFSDNFFCLLILDTFMGCLDMRFKGVFIQELFVTPRTRIFNSCMNSFNMLFQITFDCCFVFAFTAV